MREVEGTCSEASRRRAEYEQRCETASAALTAAQDRLRAAQAQHQFDLQMALDGLQHEKSKCVQMLELCAKQIYIIGIRALPSEQYNGSPVTFLPFTALCISKGYVSASAICYLWRVFLLNYYIVRPSWPSLSASVAFLIAFVSLCSLCCNIVSANDSEIVDFWHEPTLLLPSMLSLFESQLL